MNRIIVYYLLGLSWCLIGCSPSVLTPEEYLKWVKDPSNGLNKEVEIGDYRFTAQYKPAAFIALIENTRNKISRDSLMKRIKELEELEYIDLRISLKNGEDFLKKNIRGTEEFNSKQYYYSFDFQKDLSFHESTQEQDCILFHFERNYDLTSGRTFVLGFNKIKTEAPADKILQIDAKDLRLGLVKIKFDQGSIKKIPEIKM